MGAAPFIRHKVLAYITHRGRLLVFRHPDHPEAGIQVPGGTVGDDEHPTAAVLREAIEETGLTSLRLAAHLGDFEQSVPERGELWTRHCYHLVCEEDPPETWRHDELTPSDGTPAPITFEFFWVKLPDGVPELAAMHEVMVPRLQLNDGGRRSMTKDSTPPKAEDFRAELGRRLILAQQSGYLYVDVASGDLHRSVGGYPAAGGSHRMPTCCCVMKAAMVNRDKVICTPPRGKGARLVIRYHLPR